MSITVESSLEAGVMTLCFQTPAHNALPSTVLLDLEQAFLDAGRNEEAKVILFKSGGDKTFCAGASFDELITIADEAQGKSFFMGFARVILAMRDCGKIVVGQVQGKAVGGGVGLIAAMDYCLASEHALIKLSEISIGIGPFVIAPAVERKMGLAAFSALTLDAQHFKDAAFAKANGLYNEVYPDLPALAKATRSFASTLATYSPDSLTECKKIFWENTEHWPTLLEERAAISGSLVLSKTTKDILAKYQ